MQTGNIPYYRTAEYQRAQRDKRKNITTDTLLPSNTPEYQRIRRAKIKESGSIPYKAFVPVSQEWDWDNPCIL